MITASTFLSVAIFTGVILILVLMLNLAESKLLPQGDITLNINGDDDKSIKVRPGSTLLSALATESIFLPSACGGGGTCAGAARCRFSGWLRSRLAFFVALLPPRRRLSGVFANKPMSDILLRGRWKAESSGRHYVQAGRQMLIGSALPMLIARIAQRIGNLGLAALLGPDLAARLDG